MSPPEVWGPAVWTLFHTLAERVNETIYPQVAPQLFTIIVKICKFLPCPDCSNDASNFLAKIQVSNFKTKTDFKNFIYLFHNWVNVKKRKPLFNYANINKYEHLPLIPVVNNFIATYNTKGNMKLLSESFQRNLIITDFKKWISNNIHIFTRPMSLNPIEKKEPESVPLQVEESPIIVEESPIIVEESPIIVEESPIEVQESPIEEQESPIIVEESPIEEQESPIIVEESPIEEQEEETMPVFEHESLMENEHLILSKNDKKGKKGKNKKN
jgi:hypothetical protein